MTIASLRQDQPVTQGQRTPMDREWFRWMRSMLDEVNRLTAEAAPDFVQLPTKTTTERNALTAVNGMVVYNSTTGTVQAYAGGVWVSL